MNQPRRIGPDGVAGVCDGNRDGNVGGRRSPRRGFSGGGYDVSGGVSAWEGSSEGWVVLVSGCADVGFMRDV